MPQLAAFAILVFILYIGDVVAYVPNPSCLPFLYAPSYF